MAASFDQTKGKELEKQRESLVEDYKEASDELGRALGAVDRKRIRRQMEKLDAEIKSVDSQLEALKVDAEVPETGTAVPEVRVDALAESDWRLLLKRIKTGMCTPFIGCRSSPQAVELRMAIASGLAGEYNCPLDHCDDLVQVCQYLAHVGGWSLPREEYLKYCAKLTPPDPADADNSYNILATLPLPLYVTTAHDDFLMQALRNQGKAPRQDVCRWNRQLEKQPSPLTQPGFEPAPATPLVFYTHGCHIVDDAKMGDSLVLTEDDYLDFLIQVSKDRDLFPPRLRQGFTETMLLFLGYRVMDWDFRVLIRCLKNHLDESIRRPHIAVQLVPEILPDPCPDLEGAKARVRTYLSSYLKDLHVTVYWGSCGDFLRELKRRWDEVDHANQA